MNRTEIMGRSRSAAHYHRALASMAKPGGTPDCIGGRRMNQPTKDALREQLALAAAEIIRLRTLLDRPWWKRVEDRIKGRYA